MTKPPKKVLPMLILDILRRYTDADHRLSQRDIADILKTEYDMTADRKAIINLPVTVEMSMYDLSRGRITWRAKN